MKNKKKNRFSFNWQKVWAELSMAGWFLPDKAKRVIRYEVRKQLISKPCCTNQNAHALLASTSNMLHIIAPRFIIKSPSVSERAAFLELREIMKKSWEAK